jgi:Asp-tRNA(Asn)/Glu-tRNA(Gln) amidotransferase A subunit family amidase
VVSTADGESDKPWPGDAVSLVEAFRAGERTPVEELEATLAAAGSSRLNALCHLDVEAARAAAEHADVRQPFGGVPLAVKLGTGVAGWPASEASIPLADLTHPHDSTMVTRLRSGGAVLFGQSTMSEFAGLNQTRTKLHGATRNPWNLERTPGGSSGGASALVAGGICTVGTGGDGGGSIRIPAALCGLPGLKPTYGRIPKGPHGHQGNLTAVAGCLSRSVRDIARYLDVTSGHDRRDPFSLPRVDGWERDLGTRSVAGLRVVVSPDLGRATVHPAVAELVVAHAEMLVADAKLRRVDADVRVPTGSFEWAMGGMARIRDQLGERWPDCAPDLTPAIRYGLEMAEGAFGLEIQARIERQRTTNTETMAALFDEVDLVISATTPDVAFAADGPFPTEVGGMKVELSNQGALTIPANFYGNPSITIPIGTRDGLPVGMQVMARHFREDVLLDLALLAERQRPWPLVAPVARPPSRSGVEELR